MHPPPCAVKQGSFIIQQQLEQQSRLRGDEAQKRGNNTQLFVSVLAQFDSLVIVHMHPFITLLLVTTGNQDVPLSPSCALFAAALFISIAWWQLAAALPESIKQLPPCRLTLCSPISA